MKLAGRVKPTGATTSEVSGPLVLKKTAGAYAGLPGVYTGKAQANAD